MEPMKHSPEWAKANRAFWTMAKQCRLSHEDVAATISGTYKGRVSTTELTAGQIEDLTRAMRIRLQSSESKDLDKWRKRLIHAVRDYCHLMGTRTDFEYIQSIICRDGTKMNQMPKDRLIAKYNSFIHKNEELRAVRVENAGPIKLIRLQPNNN